MGLRGRVRVVRGPFDLRSFSGKAQSIGLGFLRNEKSRLVFQGLDQFHGGRDRIHAFGGGNDAQCASDLHAEVPGGSAAFPLVDQNRRLST